MTPIKKPFLTPEKLSLIGYAAISIAYAVLFYVKYKSHSSK
jgi:hypothetical protein